MGVPVVLVLALYSLLLPRVHVHLQFVTNGEAHRNMTLASDRKIIVKRLVVPILEHRRNSGDFGYCEWEVIAVFVPAPMKSAPGRPSSGVCRFGSFCVHCSEQLVHRLPFHLIIAGGMQCPIH